MQKGLACSPIDVLFRTNGFCHKPFAVCSDMVSKRQLHQYPTDLLVIIELLDNLYNLVNGRFRGQPNVLEPDPDLSCGSFLGPNIRGRIGTLACLDDGKLGEEIRMLCLSGLDPGRDLCTD